ncbi:MAG: hypothetical protein ACTHNT_12070, partial [Actinomycetales bacterium]
MPVLLQGGAEFGSRCRGMDGELLEVLHRRLGRSPVVVVLPLASPSGGNYDATGGNAVRYYRSLGARDTSLVPDPRRGAALSAQALAPVEAADLLVLPGGSPSRLREALLTPVADNASPSRTLMDLLHARVAAGVAVSGSSAGAMLLGGLTALPDQPAPGH